MHHNYKPFKQWWCYVSVLLLWVFCSSREYIILFCPSDPEIPKQLSWKFKKWEIMEQPTCSSQQWWMLRSSWKSFTSGKLNSTQQPIIWQGCSQSHHRQMQPCLPRKQRFSGGVSSPMKPWRSARLYWTDKKDDFLFIIPKIHWLTVVARAVRIWLPQSCTLISNGMKRFVIGPSKVGF